MRISKNNSKSCPFSQPLWQKVIVAQGIMSNNFIIAVNRIGCENDQEFYGSSFISTPMGAANRAGLHLPLLIRCSDILHDRVNRLYEALQTFTTSDIACVKSLATMLNYANYMPPLTQLT